MDIKFIEVLAKAKDEKEAEIANREKIKNMISMIKNKMNTNISSIIFDGLIHGTWVDEHKDENKNTIELVFAINYQKSFEYAISNCNEYFNNSDVQKIVDLEFKKDCRDVNLNNIQFDLDKLLEPLKQKSLKMEVYQDSKISVKFSY